jgi:ubiquinone/menaquinone biosynthesis C-methylase UbiE
MTTVFMKFLETKPEDYDRGIRLLTLGRIDDVKDRIADFVQPGDRVLEIGCGTGTLALRCARRGAEVVGIDASSAMLAEAKRNVAAAGLSDRIELHQMDATLIEDHFEPTSFDLIVSTLVFSEMDERVQAYVLEGCTRLLKQQGRLLLADEVVPEGLLARLLFYLVRLPLVLLTWLITRTSTAALHGFPQRLALVGFQGRAVGSWLGGSLQLFLAHPAAAPGKVSLPEVPRLRHRVNLWTLLKDLYCLLWRNIPPYLRVHTGLYRVGEPDRDSPVLVTGNYDLTVRRLLRPLAGRVDAWLLVADSAGINVWCGAGGGHFTAEKVIAAIRTSGLEDLVNHRRLILPQLCANGVKGQRIEEETAWRVRWGPCYAEDIPAYLERGRRKTDAMRSVRFPLRDRLEMAMVMWQVWAVLFTIILLIVRRSLLLPTLLLLMAMFLFMAISWPWWPTRNGMWHGVGLALISVLLLLGWSAFVANMPPPSLFNWAIGLAAMGLFVGADFQGGCPGMRGGEVIHLWKLLPIGLLLLGAYYMVPHFAGW